LLHVREGRNIDGNVKIAFARPRRGIASVMGEDVRLERVLTNLLDNAVSFSPPTGLVEISATCADNEVIIRISDEGPGIPESEREAVFRRFHTERPQGESFGEHSGLGLAIARTIIEGHQGRIRVRDREDGKNGACFELVLPFADPELV
jgi:two-component system, OmpR family, sensor histidine kinase ChvG